jgi:arginase family enzyme
VTRPGVHGVADSLEDCGLITLDAHFDLRDLSNGLTSIWTSIRSTGSSRPPRRGRAPAD